MHPGKFSPRAKVNLSKDAHLVATYSDGIPFLGYKEIKDTPFRTVAINMYPITTRARKSGYPIHQSLNELLGRATKFAACIDNF